MVIEPPPIRSPRGQRAAFAWQGWRLAVPADWNVTALGGNFAAGHALLADLDRPRLGVRWKTVEPRRVTPAFLERAVRGEVGPGAATVTPWRLEVPGCGGGELAAAHVDPDVPGRDVYAGWFPGSGRVVELVYHAHERDDVFMRDVVPSLGETSGLPWLPWSVLGLACAVPAGFGLRSHDLRAGDLQLHFTAGNRFVSVRQLAMANLALKRTTLECLVLTHQQEQRVHYGIDTSVAHVTLATSDGGELQGRCGHAFRRRRFFWHGGLPARRVTLALHDPARDRIVVVEADEASVAREVAGTVGDEVGC